MDYFPTIRNDHSGHLVALVALVIWLSGHLVILSSRSGRPYHLVVTCLLVDKLEKP